MCSIAEKKKDKVFHHRISSLFLSTPSSQNASNFSLFSTIKQRKKFSFAASRLLLADTRNPKLVEGVDGSSAHLLVIRSVVCCANMKIYFNYIIFHMIKLCQPHHIHLLLLTAQAHLLIRSCACCMCWVLVWCGKNSIIFRIFLHITFTRMKMLHGIKWMKWTRRRRWLWL